MATTTTTLPAGCVASLLSAQSSNSLQQVVLSFSSAISSSLSGPVGCSGYFLANGIAIADCTFQLTDASQLTISSTSLLPGAMLAVQANGNLLGGNGVPACGSATIAQPASPAPLSIAFSPLVPVIVSCAQSAPLRFDLMLTGGGFGRAVSSTITSPQLTAQVSSSTTTLNSVTLQPGLLPVGTVVLRGTAVDALGQTASAEQTISVVDAGTPELVFSMDPPVIVRGQAVTLRVQVQFSQCSAAQPVVVSWQNDVLASVQPALNLNSATLVLTAPMVELFAPGAASFVVRVNSGGAARSLPFETTWQVTFPYHALQLSGGSTLASATVLSEAPGTLAVQGYHPDFPAATVLYSWSCAVAAGAASSCPALLALPTLATTGTLALPGGVLAAGNSYALTVQATLAAGGQLFSASATFYRTVVTPAFPLVSGYVVYSPLGSYTAFLTSNMALDVSSLQFALDNVGGSLPLPAGALSVATGSGGVAVQAVCDDDVCTPPAGYPAPALGVGGHALSSAAATFAVLLPLRAVAAAPVPGRCSCGPDSTTAATGQAWVLCSDWQARAFISGSAALRYRFAARPLGSSTAVQLGASTSANSTLSGLPAGAAGSDYGVAVGVLVENGDGGVYDAGEVCTLRVLPPSSNASNQLLGDLLGAQQQCNGQTADTSQMVLTLTALVATANGNPSVALDSDLIFALMTALFNASCSSPITPALIVQVVDLYTALCQSPVILQRLSADDRRNLLAIYDQILAAMQLPQNAAAAPALSSSLASIGPCLTALGGGSDVVALNGITSTITQVYVNLSAGTCQGPPLSTNDTSQSVLITSSFSDNLGNGSFSSTSSSAAAFFLGETTVARLQQNYSCVFLVLTSLPGFDDKSGRLPPQAMTLFDGSTGSEIPIDGDGNSIRIVFQNPPNGTTTSTDSCGDTTTTECQFIDESASNNTDNVVWSSRGCQVVANPPPGYTVCVCEHLTYFSALLAGSSSNSCGWTWYSIATLTSVCTAAVVILLVIVAYELRMRYKSQPSTIKSKRSASSRSSEVRSMAS